MAQPSSEKLEHSGPTKKYNVASAPQSEKLARDVFAQTKRNQAISPDHKIMRWERVKLRESRTMARKRGIRTGASRVMSQLTLKGSGFQGKEGKQRESL